MSVRKHTITNVIGAIVPILVLLITVPLYLDILGDERYGVLALVWLVLGYFSFLEMGLGKATSYYIARLCDAPARKREGVFWTAVSVNIGFGILAALILWITGYYFLERATSITDNFRGEVLSALPWLVASLPLALVSSVLNGALEGRRKFLTINLLQTSSTLLFQFIPLYVAYVYSPSLEYVIPAAVITKVIMVVPTLVACSRYIPLVNSPNISHKEIKPLLSYGGWVAVSGVLGPLLETIDRFFVGMVLGARAVTYYTIPYQLVTKIRIIPASFTRALFPKFSGQNQSDAENLARDSLVLLLGVMTAIVVCGILALEPFMTVWVGREVAEHSAPIGEIFLIGIWASSVAQMSYTVLQARGRPNVVAKLHALEVIPYLMLLYFLTQIAGIYGAVVAWALRATVDAVLLIEISKVSVQSKSIYIVTGMIVITSFSITQFIPENYWSLRIVIMILHLLMLYLWFKKVKKIEGLKIINIDSVFKKPIL